MAARRSDFGGLAFDITMPDLLALVGFPAAARLSSGSNQVSLVALGFTGTGLLDPPPALGNELKGAVKSFTINVQ